jgi:pimeloyl-ACP methyl ester carboxylesterase
VDTIVGHLLPAKTQNAVLRLYRSTRAGDMEQLAARLRQYDHDALVVFGDADAYIPADLAHRQVQVFPRVDIRILRGLGHWSWLEDTDAVAGQIVPFLQSRMGNALRP